MDRRRSSTLIPEIYEATINPGHWDYVLEMLTRLTESKSACLYYQDKDFGYASTVAQYGCPVDLMLDYKHQYAKLDNLFDKVVTRTETGDILYQVLSRDSDDVIDIESDFYKNWLKPQGIFYLGRVQFLDNNSQKASIAILRERVAGVWHEGDIRIINEIVPHLRRALDIHAEFTRLRMQQDALMKGLDRLVIGLILYDRNARSVYINPTAKAIMKSHPAFTFNDDELLLRDADDNKNLHQTILDTARIDPEDSWKQSVAIGITHPDVVAPLPLLVTPMHAHLMTLDLDYEGAKVAVFLSDPNLQQPISIPNLVSVYGLTPSEAQVAISMANGHSIEDIANTSNHSAHTIRSQLKATFRKTGVSRQSELIKLLLTGPFAHRRRSKAN
ncbi:MAG: helix-turn-helix transcriptional regulator [Nitrosomonadaceae bacterium]